MYCNIRKNYITHSIKAAILTMRFSQFGQFFTSESGIVRLMDDLGNTLSSANQQLYMLGGGNPSHIPEVQAVSDNQCNDCCNKVPVSKPCWVTTMAQPGNLIFRNTLAEFLGHHYGWNISAANIAITNGSQSSFFILFNLFSGTFADSNQKKILLPLTPEYIGYEDTGLGQPILTSRRPIIEMLDDHLFKYHIDLDGLQINQQIGAVCVSCPTNPSGNVLTCDEMEALRQRTRANNIPLIIDGAYGTPFPQHYF